jgi:hypothetical protein
MVTPPMPWLWDKVVPTREVRVVVLVGALSAAVIWLWASQRRKPSRNATSQLDLRHIQHSPAFISASRCSSACGVGRVVWLRTT